MRIVCEKCRAVYLIAEKILGKNGRMVKCAKCSHCWTVKPIISAPPPIKKLNSNPYSCNSLFRQTLILIILLLMLSNIFSILVFYSDHFTKHPSLKKIYEKFSIYDNNDLVLKDFKLRKEKNNIIITGSLINNSNEDKTFPNIRYTILNQKKKILTRLTLPSSNSIIRANEALPISSKISNITESATYLQIDIGNKLDLLLR